MSFFFEASPYPMKESTIVVKASIFIGNLTTAQQRQLENLSRRDVEALTHMRLDTGLPRERDGDLLTFHIVADPSDPSYAGEAFIKEDFIDALLEATGIRPV
jgi:hypothetical protein